MKFFLITFFVLIVNTMQAQYTPGAINYGFAGLKGFDASSTIGAGVRIEYAYNCYNTFMVEYNRSFVLDSNEYSEGFNEFVLGANLILFNWDPTAITAGMGIITNDDPLFENREDGAALFFKTGDLNLGFLIKVRALHHLTKEIHLFGEFNIKSLGGDYTTFLMGFNYNFNPRR